MTRFDTFVMVDWSGGNDRGPTPRKDAIWAAVVREGRGEAPVYFRNRQLVEDWLTDLLAVELAAGRRLFFGFDFPFGYPKGFAKALTGTADPFAVWAHLAAHIEDAPARNNRFDVAAEINRRFGGQGPFWGNGLQREIEGLSKTKARYENPFPEWRKAETIAKGAFSCWQLAGAGAVGSQVLMGLPVLQRLRTHFTGHVAVWPFEPLDRPVALVEIWPSLIAQAVAQARETDEIQDRAQVRVLANAVARLPTERLDALLAEGEPEEGWIFGLGHEDVLVEAALGAPVPPPLTNDCFALPAGVDWTPVDVALERLQAQLHPVVSAKPMLLANAEGRVLAADVIAHRSNPPEANTAVDGYGFASAAQSDGPTVLPLVEGRAAAGVPFAGTVPEGHAVRVLTGAALPSGVDTVVLDEDVSTGNGQVAFRGPVKPGANTREAGEDVGAGAVALTAGRRLTPADLALLSAVGIREVPVRQALRVGVLSTGDELVEAGEDAGPGQIYDANRPMLLAMLRRFGFEAVDLGRAPDDRSALRKQLDAAARETHAILTSGGASAGDEDHVSALLRESGAMATWRIALKPGRPLALGLWNGAPVFGLPGNPVAAMVCTLIFARPALGLLAGEAWRDPVGFDVPAAFSKNKKPGRREYLRARIRDGRAEVFKSEGSGRISGLSWAEGLVEIGDAAQVISPGDPVRFIPFGSFGL